MVLAVAVPPQIFSTFLHGNSRGMKASSSYSPKEGKTLVADMALALWSRKCRMHGAEVGLGRSQLESNLPNWPLRDDACYRSLAFPTYGILLISLRPESPVSVRGELLQ